MYVIARIRLVKDSRTIQTKTGTPMVTSFGFADISGEDGLPVGVVAFSNLADVLSKYKKGEVIRVTGNLKANDYTNAQGEDVKGFQIIAEGVAGVKAATAKFQDRKPKTDAEVQKQKNAATSDFYEDALTF